MGQRFQSFWWGERLSPYEWLCLKSFIDLGHSFDLFCFNKELAVPRGVVLRDAAEIAPREEAFVYRHGYGGAGWSAVFADVFRYKLLAERGGWWVDTDVVCLSRDIPHYEEFVAREDYAWVTCAVMHFPPAHPVMVLCYEQAKQKGHAVRWGDTGPRLLTRILDETGRMAGVRPAALCCPMHYSEVSDLLLPSRFDRATERLGAALFLHLWNRTLVTSGLRKSYLPPRGSVLRNLIEQHAVEGWTGEYDEAGLIEALDLTAELKERHKTIRLLEAQIGQQSDEIAKQSDEIARQSDEMVRQADQISRQSEEIRRLEEEIKEALATADQLRAELEAMRRSRSWRLTKPLRWLIGRLSLAGGRP